MHKKDSIFWIAAVIFLAVLVIAALTGNQRYLYLLIASYFLRPTLAELGLIQRTVDERQLLIYYRSGNLAFAVMIVASVVMAVVHTRTGPASWEAFTFVVVLGLAAKTLFSLVLAMNYRTAGSRVIMAVGLVWGVYLLIDNGASIAGLASMSTALAAAVLLVAMGGLAPRFPKTIGALTFGVDFVLIYVVARNGQTVGQAATALLVCVPLLFAAASLFAFGRGETHDMATQVQSDG